MVPGISIQNTGYEYRASEDKQVQADLQRTRTGSKVRDEKSNPEIVHNMVNPGRCKPLLFRATRIVRKPYINTLEMVEKRYANHT